MEAEIARVAAPGALPADYFQAHWYALYTSPRHEKMVAAQLTGRGVEAYLPLYNTTRRWGHRRAEVQLPLFPGYVFTRIALHHRLRVLEVPGVVTIVSGGGGPLPLSDEDIIAVRNSLVARAAEPYPYLSAGKQVRVTAGPLAGLAGVIQRRKGRSRLIVSIDCTLCSVAFELEATDVELIAGPQVSRSTCRSLGGVPSW